MTYFDKYKKRMLNNGVNEADDYKNASINIVNESFLDSPSYKLVQINNIDVDSRLVTIGVNSERMNILFRPNNSFYKGDYVVIDNEDWLIKDFFESEIYPKAKIEKCNQILNWKDSSNTLHSQSCVLNVDMQYIEEEKFVKIPDGTIYVYTQYNSNSEKIRTGDRFLFNKRSFEVTTINDFTDTGGNNKLFRIDMNRVEVSDIDDIENNISNKPSSLGSRWK